MKTKSKKMDKLYNLYLKETGKKAGIDYKKLSPKRKVDFQISLAMSEILSKKRK